MALHWQEVSAKDSQAGASSNVWFGIAMGLLGVIIGYTIGTF